MSSPEITSPRIVRYAFDLELRAPRDRVWTALVHETQAWWLDDFRVLGEGSQVTFDAQAGGHLIERSLDGSTLLWFTAHHIQPGRALRLVGQIFPAWGGPATSFLTLGLAERDDHTVLSVSDALVGQVSDEQALQLESGWKALFGEGLGKFVA